MALAKLTGRCTFSKEIAGRLYYLVPRCISSVGKSTMQHEPELPKIPKKPLTTYMQFMMHHHTEVRRKYPMFTNREVHEKLVQMWQSLTFEERNLWSLKYEREKAEYDKRYEEFAKRMNTLEISETPSHNVRKRNEDKLHPAKDWEALKTNYIIKKEKVKSEYDRLGKPKAPGNLFTLYLKSIKQDGVQLKNFLVEGSAMWQELPKEKKEIFRQRAKAHQDKYESELLEWETKMCEAGRHDLVRGHNRKQLGQRLLQDKGS